MTSGSQYDIDYDNGGVEVDLWAWPEYSGTYYVLSENAVWDMWGDLLWWAETVDSVSVSVPNPRPSITSVSPTPWQAGNSYSVTVSGTGFGTNPTLQITGTGVTLNSYSCSPVDVCDTTITASVTIDPGAPSENASVTVTSTGYGGSGFLGSTGELPTSLPDSVEVDAAAPPPIPTYMLVLNDVTDVCSGCSTTARRTLDFQVMLPSGQPWSGSTGTGGTMCETLTHGTTNCTPGTYSQTSACDSPPNFVTMGPDGKLTDQWSFNSDSFTPAGCGFSTSDVWNAIAGATPPYLTPVGLLAGFLHTDAIQVNGTTATPGTSGQLTNKCVNSTGTMPSCPH